MAYNRNFMLNDFFSSLFCCGILLLIIPIRLQRGDSTTLKHFLSLADLSPEELQELLSLATKLKEEWRQGGNEPLLRGKSLALVFQKPSLRTRVSFEMAMVHLGGYAFYLSPNEIKMGGRESVPDVARVLSGYVDAVMARVFEHDHILQLAQYSTVPIINGLSDYNHPAQGFTDLFTILEHKGTLENISLSYVGDGNNVARSLLFGAMKTGMHFKIATPPGYTLTEGIWPWASRCVFLTARK
jgi:ornithine carbamoyltransferase